MTEVDLLVVGGRHTALTPVCKGDGEGARDNSEKVWVAILEQNGTCLSCPAEVAGNSSTRIHIMCKTLQTEWTIQHMLSAIITSHAPTTY